MVDYNKFMKTAIITGASQGIGSEIAKTLAKNNYYVVINYNNSEKEALELKNQLNEQSLACDIFKANIAIPGDVKALIDFAYAKYRRIDLLVNNAGISKPNMLIDSSYEDINNLVSTNLLGCIYCTKEVSNIMLSQKSGNIINIASIWGEHGGSCESVYSATKGGIISFTKALAKELGYNGIRVNCISPGFIDTKMNKNLSKEDVDDIISDIPLNRLGNVQDIANAVLWLSSDQASYVNGQILSINGGWLI